MSRISIYSDNRLCFEQLESRCILAGLPWPLAAADIIGIAATYGQYDDRISIDIGQIHFH